VGGRGDLQGREKGALEVLVPGPRKRKKGVWGGGTPLPGERGGRALARKKEKGWGRKIRPTKK